MESMVKVKEPWSYMSRLFNSGDDWKVFGLNIRYVEYAGGGWCKLVVRHPECGRNLDGTYKSWQAFADAVDGNRKR